MEFEIINKKSEKVSLDSTLWGVKFDKDVVSQAVNSYLSNQRKGSSKAKRRSEVEGGGRKPWKQKGTGRARVGSNRSPLWVGGGATFAPTGLQNFSRKINRKTNTLAISMVIVKAMNDKKLKFFAVEDLLTKKDIRNKVTENIDLSKKTLVISDNKEVLLAMRNNPKVAISNTQNLNVYELAANSQIIVDVLSLEKIEKLLKV